MTLTPFVLFLLLIIIIWFIKKNSFKRILQAIFTLTIIIVLLIVYLWGANHWGMYKRLNDNTMIGCNPSWCECPLLCPNPCECRGCDESGGDCYNLNESIAICINPFH